MTNKLPKTVIIGGREWKIVYDKNQTGGHFSFSKHTITVGTNVDDEELMQVLLHEIIEAILAERELRYTKEYQELKNEYYLFSFNHAEFEEVIKDIYLALKPILTWTKKKSN